MAEQKTEKSNMSEYESRESMTKEKPIRELVNTRLNENRLKRYKASGDSAKKVFVP